MATPIGLSMKLTASTSGLSAGLSEAEKLINKLGRGAEQAAKYFDTFADASGNLPTSMQAVVDQAGALTAAFRDGLISSTDFSGAIAAISDQAFALSAAYKEGTSITAEYATEEEKRAATITRLGELLKLGALNQETYNRALAEASGANAAAAAAERARVAALKAEQDSQAAALAASQKAQADAVKEAEKAKEAAMARGRAIIEQNMTAQEKFDAKIAEYRQLVKDGALEQTDFNRAVAGAAKEFAKTTVAAEQANAVVGDTGLKLNEMAGFLSVLPGPLGNVAGRISGFASALGGLDKIIQNPAQAIASLGPVFAAITSPLGLAVTGIVAFGAATASVTKGILELSDRVQRLGKQADKIGASFEFVQVLETAATRAGSSLEAVGASFNKFLNVLNGAKSGVDKSVKAFASLGISSADLRSKKPEEIYTLVAQAITRIEDPAKRAATATALLGKGGVELLGTFKGIASSQPDLERYFALLSDADRISFNNLDEAVGGLKTAFQGLGQSLLTPFAGLGAGIAEGVAEFIGSINSITSVLADILGPELDTIGKLFQLFGTGAGAVVRLVGDAFSGLRTILEPISGSIFPAIGAAIALINRQIIVGAIASVGPAFIAAATAGYAYVTSAGFASAATAALGAAIRVTLASTGIGAIAVVVGLAAGALIEWAVASDDASKSLDGVSDSTAEAAEQAAKWREELDAEDAASMESLNKAIDKARRSLNSAVDEAMAFGDEGFNAAVKYQTALAELEKQADAGILNETAFENEVAKVEKAFKSQIEAIKERNKAAEESAKAVIEADRKVAEQILETQRIDREFGGNKDRAKAADDLYAVEREIKRTEEAIAAAEKASDTAAADAAKERLNALREARGELATTAEFGFNQKDVDEAIKKVRKEITSEISQADIQLAPDAAETFFNTIDKLAKKLDLKIIDPKQFEEASKAAQKSFDESKKQAEKVRDLKIKYAEQAAEIEQDRINELNTLSREKLEANDVRTSEGASTVLRLATGREDPAIEEYRKQLRKLDEIKKEIAKAQQKPVEIL